MKNETVNFRQSVGGAAPSRVVSGEQESQLPGDDFFGQKVFGQLL
jgi:hypothetical protein